MIRARWGRALLAARGPWAALAATLLSAANPDPMAPVRDFLDGFNAGDTARAYAAFAPGPIAIIDEFAPHYWVGADAPRQWAAGYAADAKARGISEGHVSYGAPVRVEQSSGAAYVVVPTQYSYRLHGKAMQEGGRMTFALRLVSGAWKIEGWTWGGTAPRATSA